ncbi:outer membrane beta-barrel protein [Tenacibaculum maritimum]|uniref:outer membrane beta-barrel protein n=3 Tax=Tenacibaculum maritimum TaxID=107401 RepID=UPI0012E4331C|nr:outer membrane beta-barrel protein [Tenacibaculum maritimum]CAA0145883.1 TonB-dependent outer membrane receptor [Tenacibaculum maritimum]CAA0146110.1 TonB-dependent outer membrane receptor [Tenacibaculum maritimum]CAA0146374.1 TonB-dependent outer membrane receptor [Tenacibaculum maritimum]
MYLPKAIFLIFLFSYSSYAQLQIRGVVRDSLDVGIALAEVILETKENKIVKGVVTNKQGIFECSIKKGYYKLSIRFLGYKTWSTDIFLADNYDLGVIILHEGTDTLNEVVVQSKKPFIEKIEDKLVFNIENTFLSKGNTVAEVLRYTPNVWVGSDGDILIKQQPAAIQVNGRRIRLKGDALVDFLETINSEDIKKIEVQLNSSADLDASIDVGVVNIITKRKSGINGGLRSYYTYYEQSPYDFYNALSLNYGAEKWNFYGAYNFKESDGIGEFNSSLMYKSSKEKQVTKGGFDSFSRKHTYRLGFYMEVSENQNLGVEFYGNSNKSNFLGDNLVSFKETKGRNETKDIGDKFLNSLSLNYHYAIKPIKSSFAFYGDFLKHNYDSEILNNSIYPSNFTSNFEKNNSNSQTRVVSAQLDFETVYNKKITSKVGSKISKTKRQNKLTSKVLVGNSFQDNMERNTNFNYDEDVVSFYGILKYKENKNFFNLGFRLERTSFSNLDILMNDFVSNSFVNIFPSFYYSRTFSKKKSLSFSFSRNINRPSFNSLNNRINKINDFRFDIGNPNLAPEFTNRYELVFTLPKQSLSLYVNDTKDVINGVWRIENDIAIHQNQNFGINTQYGVIYNYNDKWKKWWQLRFSGALFYRHFKNSFLSLSKLTSSFSLVNRFQINATTFLHIDAHYTTPFISSNYKNSENISVNLYLGKSFLANKLNCRLYLDDLLNTVRTRNNAMFVDADFNFYQKRNTRGITFWVAYNFNSKKKISNKRNTTKNMIKNRL